MVPPSGPSGARIMLVGEAPGEQEVLRGAPFVGASGNCLNEMLHEAGIMRSECFLTNVCRERPPGNEIEQWIPKVKKDRTPDMVPLRDKMVKPVIAEGANLLWREIGMVAPNIIVAFGNVSLWALTGKWGIKSWRGSLLSTDGPSGSVSTKVIPVYHPAYIMRDWSARAISVQDLRRAKAEAETATKNSIDYNFIIRPNYAQVESYLSHRLSELEREPHTLSVDIETRSGHIACLGIATSTRDAICIPFMCVERADGYWQAPEETAIIRQLRAVLTHPNARIVGQNFIYDTQYIWRHWGFVPRFDRDTMLGHHSCYSGLPKGLDFLSSMYCEQHTYWKDEGKEWHAKIQEDQLWAYNCKDAVITYEADTAIQSTVDKLGLRPQHDFQQSMFWPVLQAMVRGVRVDTGRRANFALELAKEIDAREVWFERILGHPLNPRSPKKMQELFYHDLNQKPVINRKTSEITCNEEALDKIAAREPILRPLVRRITEHRSLGVFSSTFVGARLGRDGRLRCSYNIAGTSTYRLSSSTDAFDSGLNLQNIPKGGEEDEGLELPNVRTLFIPDPGYTFFEGDLSKADAHVVIWEANDEELKSLLREGYDLHAENAKLLGCDYAMAKRWVHGTNYGGSPRTMAINCGLTVHQAERMQTRWFQAHPGIARWHIRVANQLRTQRYVENRFGFRRYFFDRLDSILPEALAFGPQSCVAHYINRIWREVYLRLPDVQILLQVHDSLAGQIPTHLAEWGVNQISLLAKSVTVPYDDPLVIPLKIKTSIKSWGDCE